MSDKDKISIIMGVYNCESTVSEAIESILNQIYTNWEFIICDDASTDNTYSIVKEYADKYPNKIILIKNDVNRRLAYSLNHCLEYANGEYIARMDGDDISLPDRFQKQIEWIKANDEYDLIGTAMQYFNDEGVANIVHSIENPDYYTLKNRIPFHHATILTKREVFDKLGGYTVSKRTMRAQDYDLWFRFYYHGFKGNNMHEALYLVREDDAAIRRRTFSVRWNGFKTTCYGFHLLSYPKIWLVKPFMVVILKSIIPYALIEKYRELQKKRYLAGK